MTRVLNMLFHQSPYWGWMAVGVVLGGLLVAWLLFERFAKHPQTKVRARSTIFTSFVVLDLALLVVLASLHVARMDLTRDKLYSLSPVSRSLVSKLDDTVTVEVFFPEEIPPEMVAFRESLVDLLDEFRSASGGQLTVRYLDPREAGVAERAKALGIEPAPFTAIEAGNQVTKEIMRGVAVTYKGRTERIPVIDRDVGLEYQITTLLKTLTGKPRKVGILTGHKELQGALDQPQFLETLKNVLSYHEIVTVSLDGGAKAVPADVSALFVTTPTDPLTDAELYQLDQFVMRGGALAFLGNGFTVAEPPPQMQQMGQMQLPEIKPLDEKLAAFLDHFGLKIGDDVVLDDSTEDGVKQRVTGMQVTRGGAIQPQYSLMTNVFWTKDVAENHPVVFGIKNPLVYQASTVDLSEAVRSRNDARITTLIRSPDNTWLGSSSEVMFPLALGGMPPQEPPEAKEGGSDEERARSERGPRPLMAAIEGPMESFYKGKEVPSPATAEGRKDKTDAAVRILGFGTAVPLIPEALKGGLAGNPALRDIPTLLLNMVDWLLAEKGLLEVRGKSAEPPPFKGTGPDASSQRKFTWLLILGWPVVFVALALGGLVLVRYYRKGPAMGARPGRREEPEKDSRKEGKREGDAKSGDEAASGKEVKP